VVRWQQAHGRHNLPWQKDRDPYRVWLAEVMLQQTQVATVIPYFVRFTQRWPTVESLAHATLAQVMGAWSGLGYYHRARMLWECARMVQTQRGGAFPASAQALAALPGIGRSTAAAIAATCWSERVAILDANARRVLQRHAGLPATAKPAELWELAHAYLPSSRRRDDMPTYTQGVMDLGATVCTARSPRCAVCPLEQDCQSRDAMGDTPGVRSNVKASARPELHWWLAVLIGADGAVWLQQRPSSGIWAGLACTPCFEDEAHLRAALPATPRNTAVVLPEVRHALTHRLLHLHAVLLHVPRRVRVTLPGGWVAARDWPQCGLPAPVRRLLLQCVPSSSR
jgi:A/G-specific adenine glycosylase